MLNNVQLLHIHQLITNHVFVKHLIIGWHQMVHVLNVHHNKYGNQTNVWLAHPVLNQIQLILLAYAILVALGIKNPKLVKLVQMVRFTTQQKPNVSHVQVDLLQIYLNLIVFVQEIKMVIARHVLEDTTIYKRKFASLVLQIHKLGHMVIDVYALRLQLE